MWNTPLLYFVHSVNRCAQFDSSKLLKSPAGQESACSATVPQCNSPAATYTSACETPSPRHNKAALLRACETPTMHANFSNCGTPSETMHANFSTCGAEGWLAPTGACAAPAWARWAYFEPWVATIAFFVWIAVYKTLECGGDVRAAIKAQVDGDEKHVRIAGISAEINQCVRPTWRYYLLFWQLRRSTRVLGVLARGVLGLFTRTFDFRTGPGCFLFYGRRGSAGKRAH